MLNPPIQDVNQFIPGVLAGQADLQFAGSAITCQVNPAEATALLPGAAVKILDNAGAIPQVTKLAADTDKTFGFIIRNLKDGQFAANARIEVALTGSVIYLTAGAAIARGANVEVVSATSKVITSAGTNPVVGWALDKATANNDLIRVYVVKP